MFPNYQSHTVAHWNGTAGSINKPSGVVDGDLLIMQLFNHESTGSGSIGTGTWIPLTNRAGTSINQQIFYKIASSEPASYSLSGGVNGRNSASLTRIDNYDPGDIFDHVVSNNGFGDITLDSGYNPTGNNLMLFLQGVTTTSSAGGGAVANDNPSWTEYFNNVGTNARIRGTRATRAATTATGNITATAADHAVHSFISINVLPPAPPDLDTDPVDDITTTTATLNGEITSINGDNADERGFVYSTTSHGDPGAVAPAASGYEDVAFEAGSFGTGVFDEAVSGLLPSTTYYVRAYAVNGEGYNYGAEVNFTTLTPDPPTVDTAAAANITGSEALGNGEITDDGGQAADQVGFVLSTSTQSDPGSADPEDSGYEIFVKRNGSVGEETFVLAIKNLEPDTTYYYRAFAKNSSGYNYGDEVTFDTLFLAPVISSIDPAGIPVDSELTSITIHGSNFRSGATVEVDGEACDNIVVVDENTITCDVPVSEVAKDSILIVTNDDDQDAMASFFYIQEVEPTPQPGSVSATFSVKGVGYLT